MAGQRSTGFTLFRKGGKGMLFLISFLIASVIWFVNALSKTYVTDLDYSLVSPAGSGKEDIPVQFTIKGQGFTLLRLHMRINGNTYPLSTFSRSLNCIEFTDSLLGDQRKSVSLANVKPATLTGAISSGHKLKKVPVKNNVVFSYAQRYGSSVGVLIKPDSVEVAGPASILDTLKYINTESQILNDLQSSLFRSVSLKTPAENCWLQQDKIWMYIPVEEFTEASFRVPVKTTNNKVRLIPEIVTLKCLVPLSRYSSLNSSQFRVEVAGSENTSSEKVKLRVSRKPSFVRNVKTEPNFVSILIFDK